MSARSEVVAHIHIQDSQVVRVRILSRRTTSNIELLLVVNCGPPQYKVAARAGRRVAHSGRRTRRARRGVAGITTTRCEFRSAMLRARLPTSSPAESCGRNVKVALVHLREQGPKLLLV